MELQESFDIEQTVDDLLGFAASNIPRFGIGYSLDDTCGRIGLGELGLIWARSSTGKSTFFLNTVANTPSVPTVIFNMEMTPRRQLEWLTAMTFDLSVPARAIEDTLREGPEAPGYAEIVSSLRAMSRYYPDLHFVHPQSPTVTDLAMTVDELEDTTGVRPQRVYIDHLTLMDGARDYEGVTKTAAALHTWAMQEDLAVVAVQQTGRGSDMGRNDGHVPVTLSSGVYAGEHDADWIWGMYRPEKDPQFKRPRSAFRSEQAYQTMLDDKEAAQGITRLQLIKNRPYGEVRDVGIVLRYDPNTRRFIEGDE